MAIAKIPREKERERERERERCHDEDVCNLFLTRIEFHHATTIFVPPHAGIIIRLGPREYCNGFPYKISRDRCCRPFAPQLSALPLAYPRANFGLLLREERRGHEKCDQREGSSTSRKRLQHVGSEKSNRWPRSIIGGTIIQEPERDGSSADESRTVHRLFALFAWVACAWPSSASSR